MGPQGLQFLGSSPEGFLFPSRIAIAGQPKSAEQFVGPDFKKTIHADTGLRNFPHILRRFAATLYITNNPEGVEVVHHVLRHTSVDMTHRSYAGVYDLVAVCRYDELTLGICGAILKEVSYG
ncbi:site-specific integrase [Rubellimicrobium roseum]|uniref:Tyr recombinase domain-containing protein n=1 Tax=Rubellimicrobium roseum TaxID=687525 RepID=A0A5C4N3X1_9RHOB|nr:site-specific integrase [Rubellimicrobium roseum]TNC61415.1 hypothetical protein FHG71_21195 [Rubellimicrobium roseum]